MTESERQSSPAFLISIAEMGGCPEIDLHGMDAVGAQLAVEGFLARSYAAGDAVVKVIHGKGTGRLQETVRELLSRHPLVAASSGSSSPSELGAVMYAVIARNV